MQTPNTQPLIKNGKRLTRRFLGSLFPKNGYEKAELKAYLKGHSRFNYKTLNDPYTGAARHVARQEYLYV